MSPSDQNAVASLLTKESGSPGRLSEVVYDGIVALIAQGDFAVNSRLPSEAELSTRFGASRPVIREALGRLREDGLIVSRQGSGSYVRRQPDLAVLHFTQVKSLADVQRCFEFRAGMEAAAASLAAEQWQDDDLKRIEDAMEALELCMRKGELGADEDRRLHEAIATATRNPYYIAVQSSLASHIAVGMNITRHLTRMRTPAHIRIVQDEHVAVVDAIRRRDAKSAAEAMRQHVLNARERMFAGV
jgi:GntR family transcriptional regulator, transcriptional repressor for pyruvate dehydrogenase complex